MVNVDKVAAAIEAVDDNFPSGNICNADYYRALAQAAIDALELPVVWGFGIPTEYGDFDANANTFYSKADAEKAMRQHDKIFPDDRRRLAWHFGSGPWRAGDDN